MTKYYQLKSNATVVGIIFNSEQICHHPTYNSMSNVVKSIKILLAHIAYGVIMKPINLIAMDLTPNTLYGSWGHTIVHQFDINVCKVPLIWTTTT